jgi:Na+-transporting methylmalonyl-CoA/oxaloacetate decarboxylase beta subunit
MFHRSMLELGGKFAILVGIGYILVALTHFLMPRAQLRGAIEVRTAFYESLAKASTVFTIHYWLVAVSSLLGIGVVLAFGELIGEQQSGFLSWATALGISGAILAAVDFIFVGLKAPRQARRFQQP